MKEMRVRVGFGGEARLVVEGVRVPEKTEPGRIEQPLDAAVRILRGWLGAEAQTSPVGARKNP